MTSKFASQCHHEQIIAGNCPWCGTPIYDGRPEMQWLLEVFEPHSRTAAPNTLQSIVPNKNHECDDLQQLVAFLRHKDERIRLQAVSIVAGLGPSARDLVSDIVPLLKDESFDVRQAAVEAIIRIRS